MKELESSNLIQTLEAPRERQNPFAFGGGAKNGGMSDEAMAQVNSIFSFRYMGAAEYEYGALPKAFNKIIDNLAAYSTWDITINERKVYIIGDTELKNEISTRIEEVATDDGSKHCQKAHAGVDSALGLDPHYKNDTAIGWLDLKNAFFFFIDEMAFEKTKELFFSPEN